MGIYKRAILKTKQNGDYMLICFNNVAAVSLSKEVKQNG